MSDRDIERARAALQVEGPNGSALDLGLFLSHLLPRQPRSISLGFNTLTSGTKLTDLPPVPCDHRPYCSEEAPVYAIQHSWPQVLHIIPDTAGLGLEDLCS